MKLFKPEHFEGIPVDEETGFNLPRWQAELIAKHASALLEAEAAKWPVVYGLKTAKGNWNFAQNYCSLNADTHTARLFDIQELPKKECEHVPLIINWQFDEGTQTSMTCRKCNAKLKPKWELAE